jgi:hypothetical protein
LSASLAIDDLVLSGVSEVISVTPLLFVGSLLDDLLLGGTVVSDPLPSSDLLMDSLILSGTTFTYPRIGLSADLSIDSFIGSATALDSGNPALDYQSLTKWDILRGCVDLVGTGPNNEGGSTYDARPGNGMYLDLIGTDPANSPGGDTTAGKIRTKQSFAFKSGNVYRLSFYYCEYATVLNWVDVSIGDTGGIVAPTRFTDGTPGATGDFKLGEIEWMQGSDASGKVIFDHKSADLESTTQGILVDRVKLENLTTNEEMFFDNFDYENP